jgi:antirestriction protein
MTIKEKFSSIDQSKLTADQKSFLSKIKNVTKDFSIKDKDVNDKVEGALDKMIATLKEKMPEAIKSKSTTAPKTPRKRSVMSVAKEIKKPEESFEEAKKRATKKIADDKQSVKETIKSELDKLNEFIKKKKTLQSIKGTDLLIDSKRKAKPVGRRLSKTGNVYYEYRDSKTDRLSPDYPKNAPYLAGGGKVDVTENINLGNNFILEVTKAYYTDGNFTYVAQLLYKNYTFKYFVGVPDTTREEAIKNVRNYVKTLKVSDKIIEDKQLVGEYGKKKVVPEFKVFYTDRGGEHLKYANTKKEIEEFIKDVNSLASKKFELGGSVVTDLAGHQDGTFGVGNHGMLDGFSNTAYTGLVGETGAMSSGEMFMNGGGLPDGAEQSYVNYYLGEGASQGIYKDGGTIENQYEGKTPEQIWNMLSISQRYHFLHDHKKEIESTPASVEKATKTAYKFLPEKIKISFKNHIQMGQYARGGGVRKVGNREYSYGRNWTNDHRHVNKSENHEVTYNRKGKFLGIFAGGGGVFADGRIVLRTFNGIGGNKNKTYSLIKDDRDSDGKPYFTLVEKPSGNIMAQGDDFEEVNNVANIFNGKFMDSIFAGGGSVKNERLHVNHSEDYEVRYAKPRPSRKGYKGARKFMAGGKVETPKIYVADLEAYNNGRLVGEWLDLTDYNDADELMDAIQDVLKKSGGEEYAIHDYENLPRSMYSEYMGARDFAELYEMMDLAKENDLPLDVVMEIVSQFDRSALDEYTGVYDSEQDFAEQLVDDIGITSFNDFQYYLEISETDRRLLAQEDADSYVDDIRDEDGGNRLIEEADLDVEEYEEADSERQEEMLDEAREIVYNRLYDRTYDALNDPYSYYVDELGIYDAESFANANFVRVDYEKLADALEDDYTFVRHDGQIYVFNIR